MRSSSRDAPAAQSPVGSARITPKSGGTHRLWVKRWNGDKCWSLEGVAPREGERGKREKRLGEKRKESGREEKQEAENSEGIYLKVPVGPRARKSPALRSSRLSKAPEAGAQTCARPGPITTASPHLRLGKRLARGIKQEAKTNPENPPRRGLPAGARPAAVAAGGWGGSSGPWWWRASGLRS